MNNRPSLGFDDDDDVVMPQTPKPNVLDLSGFQPKPVTRPDKAEVAQAAAKTNFRSREPKAQPVPAPAPAAATPKRIGRRRLTGRSAQLNIKIRQDTMDAFYAIADAHNWVLGEAFEKAVALLEKEYK